MYPNLNAELARRGMNARVLSANVDMSESAISRRLSGKIDITVALAKKIQKVVAPNIPIEVLFATKGD